MKTIARKGLFSMSDPLPTCRSGPKDAVSPCGVDAAAMSQFVVATTCHASATWFEKRLILSYRYQLFPVLLVSS